MKKTKLGYWAVSTMGLWIVVMGLILLGGYCLSDGKVSAGGGAWGWQLILFSVWIFLVAGVVTGWKHRGDDTYLAPISAAYRKPMFEAVGLQIVLGFLSFSILDGGVIAEIFGIALVAFWGGMAVLIARRRYAPSRVDLFLLAVWVFAGVGDGVLFGGLYLEVARGRNVSDGLSRKPLKRLAVGVRGRSPQLKLGLMRTEAVVVD